ncbi:inhibitor of Bruton tyrosine kinase-like isoform X2 [Latimeria chalumnae]|uniref:inhibitor of Bruton tyrosine kinase-like isoform X2 n=1 Tax=Latimeria chalumnae TaxID=7897 RepID=UPI00313AF7B8
MSSLAGADCTPKCRSLQHAQDVISVLTRGNEGQIKVFLSTHCYNATTLKDHLGRSALHIAASCGKKGVVDWLLEVKGADPSVKDKESGWTALHRSIFYGHIDCAMVLLKHGSGLLVQDKEGLTALDLAMKDRPAHVVFRNSDPTEVYTWGNNINFTLGHGSQQSKHHPELVDLFPRTGVYIKQVVLCKFHSVFLSQKGQIYTCGHGQGGRLGHGDEQTYLIPRMVDGLISHRCSQVAAAKDHTVVLTEDGYVYTFGLNTFHQLGIVPPPASSNLPRQVHSKNLKGRTVIGVAAGRFHTVLWTREAVYTMGLNGGQLGYLLDPNGEKCIAAPRQVSALHHKDITISLAAASDGATVCVTEKGDVYLLTDYQCKKLASKQLNIRKVLVTGGFLDHRTDPQVLQEGGGEKVCILALDAAGRVFCWRSATSSVKQCRWAYGRQVFMSDVALSKNGLMFITKEGEGFTGQWTGDAKRNSEKKEDVSNLLNSPVLHFNTESNDAYERIRLEKLLSVHRAVSVTMDSNGRNFAVLQSDPKTCLYEIPMVSSSTFTEDFSRLLCEAEEMDSIHDVTFRVGSKTFPAHKYILAMRSDYFRKVFFPEGVRSEPPDICQVQEDAVHCDSYVLEKVHPEMFAYVLQFVYTDTCDLLTPGYKPQTLLKEKTEDYQDCLITNLQRINFHEKLNGKSAYEVYRNQELDANSKKQKTKSKNTKKGKGVSEEVNSIKMLQGIARKFGLGNLSARLDGVKLENGKISIVHKKSGNKLKFNQKKCSFLCAVRLRSEDGKEFPCHKCVLCARLEYFHSMLSSSWIEASCCTALDMPIHSEILQVILDYIYTDEAPAIKESLNIEFVCNVLVVADQLLISRLKEMCEVAITEKLTLKNAAELLEFASMYNADQLKLSCLQFIGLNMAALLEARALDILSDEVLKELSVAYRKMIPAMEKRFITPYPDGPDIGYLDSEDVENSVYSKMDTDAEQTHREVLVKKAKTKAKKKPRKRSDSSGGYNLSDVIQSPPSTGLLKAGKTNSVESLQEFLTSDSEESYAGMGSPRDLQSPDFTAAFNPDKMEVEDKFSALGARSLDSGVEVKLCKTPSSDKASTPQSIPGNRKSTGSTPSWMGSSLSPASPSALDLRAIMEMEESMQSCGATPKTNAGGNKPSSHGTRLSQKQRKMIAMAAKDSSTGANAVESTPVKSTPSTPTTPAKAANAWATPLFCSSSPKPFRDLLFQEEGFVKSGQSPASCAKKVCFKGTEQPEQEKSSGWLVRGSPGPAGDHVCDTVQPENLNPWLTTAVSSPPAAAPITFAAIVEEELQQEAALIRSREKPLALIQIEEHAIHDLLVHYEALDNPEEFIIVERASKGPIATPMWNKH